MSTRTCDADIVDRARVRRAQLECLPIRAERLLRMAPIRERGAQTVPQNKVSWADRERTLETVFCAIVLAVGVEQDSQRNLHVGIHLAAAVLRAGEIEEHLGEPLVGVPYGVCGYGRNCVCGHRVVRKTGSKPPEEHCM